MLSGTDLASAYGYDMDPSPKPAPPPATQLSKKHEEPKIDNSVQLGKNMDPNFLTADQKLHMLSQELFKQKEQFEQNKNNSYVDKMLSRKKEIVKLVTISFVVLFAISLHYFIDYYLKKYFDENVMGGGKEVMLRLLYPAGVLFLLWNIKAFNK